MSTLGAPVMTIGAGGRVPAVQQRQEGGAVAVGEVDVGDEHLDRLGGDDLAGLGQGVGGDDPAVHRLDHVADELDEVRLVVHDQHARLGLRRLRDRGRLHYRHFLSFPSFGFWILDFRFWIGRAAVRCLTQIQNPQSTIQNLSHSHCAFRSAGGTSVVVAAGGSAATGGASRRRQEEDRPRAFAGAALQPDRPAARFHPPQGLGQAQPAAPAGGLVAEERVERPLGGRLVHAAAVVGHRHHHPREYGSYAAWTDSRPVFGSVACRALSITSASAAATCPPSTMTRRNIGRP